MDAKTILRTTIFAAVGLLMLNGAATSSYLGAGSGVAPLVITAGEGTVAPLLLISSGLLFMVRRKLRRN